MRERNKDGSFLQPYDMNGLSRRLVSGESLQDNITVATGSMPSW